MGPDHVDRFRAIDSRAGDVGHPGTRTALHLLWAFNFGTGNQVGKGVKPAGSAGA